MGPRWTTAIRSAHGSQTRLFDRNGRLLVIGFEAHGTMRWMNGGLEGGHSTSSSSSGGWHFGDGGSDGGHSTSSSGSHSDGNLPLSCGNGSSSSSSGWFSGDGGDAGFSSSSSSGGWWWGDASAHP